MPTVRFSMATTDGASEWLQVPRSATGVIASILIGSSYSWGSDTVDLQYTVALGIDEQDDSVEEAQTYPTAVQFSTSATSRRRVAAVPGSWVRFKTSAASGSGDPDARGTVEFVA